MVEEIILAHGLPGLLWVEFDETPFHGFLLLPISGGIAVGCKARRGRYAAESTHALHL